jgi:hypothetical protein
MKAKQRAGAVAGAAATAAVRCDVEERAARALGSGGELRPVEDGAAA